MKVKTMTSDLKIINYKYLRNNLTDDNIRTIEIDPEHFLNETDRISLNLSRNFNVSKLSQVFLMLTIILWIAHMFSDSE